MKFNVTINDKAGKSYNINLEADIFEDEQKHWNGYIPTLGLASCGTTEGDAERMITEAAQILLQESLNMGTINEVLGRRVIQT